MKVRIFWCLSPRPLLFRTIIIIKASCQKSWHQSAFFAHLCYECMIPERLFCVKDFRWAKIRAVQGLQPAAATHPDGHDDRSGWQGLQSDLGYLRACPADKISYWFKEFHAKESGDECDGHGQRGNDRADLHPLVRGV